MLWIVTFDQDRRAADQETVRSRNRMLNKDKGDMIGVGPTASVANPTSNKRLSEWSEESTKSVWEKIQRVKKITHWQALRT